MTVIENAERPFEKGKCPMCGEPEDYEDPIVQVDLRDKAPPAEPKYPRTALFQSDYSPDTTMRITMTEDGDVIFKIRGPGKMRIATSGGQFHGAQLIKICAAARALMQAIEDAG